MDKVIKQKVLTTGVYSTGAANLNNYYTKEEVNILVDKLTSGNIDLTNYYTKAETDRLIPTDYLTEIREDYITESELDNYYTKSEVDNKVANSGTFDSSQYYNKSEVDSLIPTDYITEDELDDYVTEEQLDANGYLTVHQDISGKQDTISDLEDIRNGATLGATAIQEHQSLADYALKSEIPSISNLATKDELSNKADLAVLDSYQPKGNYLTEVPSEYVTESVVDNKIATQIGNIETILDNIIG